MAPAYNLRDYRATEAGGLWVPGQHGGYRETLPKQTKMLTLRNHD